MLGHSPHRAGLGAASRGLLLALLLGACNRNKEPDLVAFNTNDDVLLIEVTASEDLGDPVEIELHSNTGAVVVGSAVLDPGSGPVGTDHLLTVEVLNDWQEVVTLASVKTEAPGRGSESYDLRQDSADHGLWVIELMSLGEEGEVRTDTLSVRLWHPEDVDPNTGK